MVKSELEDPKKLTAADFFASIAVTTLIFIATMIGILFLTSMALLIVILTSC